MNFQKKAVVSAVLMAGTLFTTAQQAQAKYFNRVATFPVCMQLDPTCNTNTETSAEIVSATKDGRTLVYTDSPAEQVGIVDITDIQFPQPKGVLKVGGEPTSVYIKGHYALVGVNTSKNYKEPSGALKVVDISGKANIVASLDLGGQPDSVAISKDGKYAAVAIENERDEDLVVNGDEGALPQAPAGKLVIVDIANADPSKWTTRDVNLTGLSGMLENTDPEPEYVDFNGKNEILVTLQENNHIAIVDARTGKIKNHFSAGNVTLKNVDTKSEKPRLVMQKNTLSNAAREPDGVTWIDNNHFATANEGDWKGGSRGFSIFHKNGKVVFDSGNSMEHMTAKFGHYPEKRSKKKGNEPENAEYGRFGNDKLLFIASERASLVFVYDVRNPRKPKFKQVLPAGVAPEGILAIPNRNLLIAASEKDDRKDKMRSSLNIYQYQNNRPMYPSLQSVNHKGVPIAWGAMSGLAAKGSTLYSVNDSFYGKNSIFQINTAKKPAKIVKAMAIKDSFGKLAALPATQVANGAKAKDASRNKVFDNLDIKAMINDDKTVNIDPEGIAVSKKGGFWIASEGSGTLSEPKKRPLKSLNMILKTDNKANITDVFTLPKSMNAKQVRFGFEGVAEYNGMVYVAIQRAWAGDKHPHIGILNPNTRTWKFVQYPLDKPESQRKSWVGLSDITPLGKGKFAVLERDNQGGPDAAIKRIYEIDLNNVSDGQVISKRLMRDLLASGDLTSMNNLPFEKVEGLTIDGRGNAWIINDNDGVDDNSGETSLRKIGKL